ncbi:MAG: Holliday junction branch migration protein RuvA [Clostridium sp.]|nr:Holliday junction branch migration protein RuvA [Clostridium sp.]
MIEYVKGKIDELTPATVTVETSSGVGYIMSISLATYASLEGKDEGKIYVHEAIRDDAWQLYGFVTTQERELFRLLIGVSGVGANTARMILSSLSVAELEETITSGNPKPLKSVKGVGAKTAERIIIDLHDKIKPSEATLIEQMPGNGETFEEALTALIVLGYARAQAQKVLKKLFETEPTLKVDAAIRKALALM